MIQIRNIKDKILLIGAIPVMTICSVVHAGQGTFQDRLDSIGQVVLTTGSYPDALTQYDFLSKAAAAINVPLPDSRDGLSDKLAVTYRLCVEAARYGDKDIWERLNGRIKEINDKFQELATIDSVNKALCHIRRSYQETAKFTENDKVSALKQLDALRNEQNISEATKDEISKLKVELSKKKTVEQKKAEARAAAERAKKLQAKINKALDDLNVPEKWFNARKLLEDNGYTVEIRDGKWIAFKNEAK